MIPLLALDFGPADGMRFEVPISVAVRGEQASAFAVDREGTALSPRALDTEVRVGARFDSRLALVPLLAFAEYEHDLYTGPVVGRTELEGIGMPFSTAGRQELRKAMGRASLGPYLHLIGGVSTSDFGMGLLANDGTHGWTPGSALFADPRGGDRVIRGALATGPLGERALFAALAVDRVIADDVTFEGDEAIQISFAFLYGRKKPDSAGAYVVHRRLDAPSGGNIRVTAVDLTGKLTLEAGGAQVVLEAEGALVFGTTTLAATPELPVKDVLQAGLAARATADAGGFGGALDLLVGSGDANLDDGAQHAFKADPNYPLGLVLFRHVLAGQSARAPYTASDPSLVGVPPADLDRFPTRGSPSGALALFPRGFVRPLEGLEVYGGPLLAFSTAKLADPFNTRLAGGAARNARGGDPGLFLGLELDLGARWRVEVAGTELTLGVEGGVLFPGSAFDGASGEAMGAVAAGRAMVDYRL